MTFARLDRVLTRIWLGLAACLVLAGGLRLGAAVGATPRVLDGDRRCAASALDEPAAPGGPSLIHRDPGTGGNLRQARP